MSIDKLPKKNKPTAKALRGGHTAVLGKGMLKNNALLPALLEGDVARWYPWYWLTKQSSKNEHQDERQDLPKQFAGWGQKKSYRRAAKAANKLNRPVISIEDGFLRSIDSGINSRHGCSVVIDDVGIYFNSHHASKLEKDIIYRAQHWNSDNERRAQQAIDNITAYRLSKYNSTLSCPNLNGQYPNTEHVLLIDQVEGDASVAGAGANKKQFIAMLAAACQNHPQAHIWIKAHPASKQGYLNNQKVLHRLSASNRQRVTVLDTPVNAIALLEQVDHVYSVSSHMGFEALMLNKSVYCFGVSWYAGWGLTNDKYAPKKLLKKALKHRQQSTFKLSPSLLQLFYAAYIDYSHYADPATKQSCELEQVIEWLNTNRYWFLKLPARLTVYEFSRWKVDFVKGFLQVVTAHGEASLKYKPKPKFRLLQKLERFKVDLNHDVLVWGLAGRQKVRTGLNHIEHKIVDTSHSMPNIWCMEDGFVRSNGLGATLLAPLSVVIDGKGIYYNATQPSDLEDIIAQCPTLTESQLQRVKTLHHKLLKQRVSKYHVGKPAQLMIPQEVKEAQKPVILIVGQVEDDLSVRFCGSLIKTNAALIKRVKQDNPTAYLIFKPHPDVEAGLRMGDVDKKTLKLVDEVAHDVAMPDCLDVVDEVHTISSLTGFEALLRGKKVTCYGLPFYAGWGLITDIDAEVFPKSDYITRRKQARLNYLKTQQSPFSQTDDVLHEESITLEQLIYCTLIQYPLYRLPEGYGLAQIEQVIDYLYPTSDAKNNNDTTQTVSGELELSKGVSLKQSAIQKAAIKRQVATRFMQVRHAFKKRLQKR